MKTQPVSIGEFQGLRMDATAAADCKGTKGKLPYGLSFYDPMWWVEEKLRNLSDDDELPRTRGDGISYEGSSPNHLHYWTVYKRLGMTVIYDEPFPDEDVYIYAILISK